MKYQQQLNTWLFIMFGFIILKLVSNIEAKQSHKYLNLSKLREER